MDVDIFIHHDYELADSGSHGPDSHHGLQRLKPVLLPHGNNHRGRRAAAFGETDIFDRKPEIADKMAADLEFASHALDATGLAWRHLAEKGLIDRVTPVSNAGDLKHRIVSPRAHIARILPKRPFRLPSLTRDSAFDDDFRRSRHLEVNSQAFDHLDRFAADATRRGELIHSHRKRADRSKTDRRIGAENDGGFGGATLGLIFLDVLPHAGTRIDHHSAFTGAFDLNPICSHIPDARFRIAG